MLEGDEADAVESAAESLTNGDAPVDQRAAKLRELRKRMVGSSPSAPTDMLTPLCNSKSRRAQTAKMSWKKHAARIPPQEKQPGWKGRKRRRRRSA